MSKFHGIIGYIETVQSKEDPDIWYAETIEREYYGDVLKNHASFQNANQVNDNLTYSNQISIVADPYAREHFAFIAYVIKNGVKWKVTGVEEQRPRLILTIGGVYNDGEEK